MKDPPSFRPRINHTLWLRRRSVTAMTSATTDNILTQFHWTPQPEAERLIKELVDAFLERCPYAHDLARRMTIETGTRFRDWIDHIAIAPTPELRGKLLRAGYDETDTGIFRNRHGI